MHCYHHYTSPLGHVHVWGHLYKHTPITKHTGNLLYTVPSTLLHISQVGILEGPHNLKVDTFSSMWVHEHEKC